MKEGELEEDIFTTGLAMRRRLGVVVVWSRISHACETLHQHTSWSLASSTTGPGRLGAAFLEVLLNFLLAGFPLLPPIFRRPACVAVADCVRRVSQQQDERRTNKLTERSHVMFVVVAMANT